MHYREPGGVEQDEIKVNDLLASYDSQDIIQHSSGMLLIGRTFGLESLSFDSLCKTFSSGRLRTIFVFSP